MKYPNMKKYIITWISMVCILGLSSCEKYLEAYSPNLVTVKSISDLDEVLIGSVYIPSRTLTSTTSNQLATWLNFVDDDVNTVMGASTATSPIDPRASSAQMNFMYGYTTWQYDVSQSYDKTSSFAESGTWKDLYARINICNIILNEIEKIDVKKDHEIADYHRVKAEALFLRAQFYFMLVNIYGQPYDVATASQTLGVPLKLTHYVEHENKKDQQFERAPLDKIYTQIKEDLLASIENFAKGSIRETHLRATGNAAKVLLSRVGLFTEQYDMAKKYAEEVVKDNALLQQLPEASAEFTFFTMENPEVLFSQGSLNFQTSFSAAPRDFCVSADLVTTFDAKDKRKNVFFKTTRYSDSTALNLKYKNGIHQSYFSDQFLIRSGEAFLNLAEASAFLGDESTANTYLNRLKGNRIIDYKEETLAGKELVDEIRAERRRELCFEGHRWFDIRRYSVNSKYPFSRPIVRAFGVFTDNGTFIQKEEYILKENDPAYTLQIPADVREFQPGMPVNAREVREPSKVINIKF